MDLQAMDYAKLDAGLAGALSGVSDPDDDSFVVFVRTKGPPSGAAATVLQRCGVNVREGAALHTGQMSARKITQLSEEPWVTRLSLSRLLRSK
jgi:hypothetical protein